MIIAPEIPRLVQFRFKDRKSRSRRENDSVELHNRPRWHHVELRCQSFERSEERVSKLRVVNWSRYDKVVTLRSNEHAMGIMIVKLVPN